MLFAATWMDLEVITQREVSQRKTCVLWYHFYVESKNYTNELIYKTDSHTKSTFIVSKGETGGGGIN